MTGRYSTPGYAPASRSFLFSSPTGSCSSFGAFRSYLLIDPPGTCWATRSDSSPGGIYALHKFVGANLGKILHPLSIVLHQLLFEFFLI